ncbi:hypothetical protein GOODEAATRI_018550, partial [Goodea atripinnis]
VAASDVLCSFRTRQCLSLLEAIEGLGQAGFVDQDVDVVVQRVYSIPIADCSPVSFLKHRASLRSSTAPPPAEKGKTRYCKSLIIGSPGGLFGSSLCPKETEEIKSCSSTFCHLLQLNFFLLLEVHADFFSRSHMFLLRDMMCLSGRAIVHGAAGPTECSRCLQPYGIP